MSSAETTREDEITLARAHYTFTSNQFLDFIEITYFNLNLTFNSPPDASTKHYILFSIVCFSVL